MAGKRRAIRKLADAVRKARQNESPNIWNSRNWTPDERKAAEKAQKDWTDRNLPEVPVIPAAPFGGFTGEWDTLGNLRKEDVDEDEAWRLQQYLDRASLPAGDPGKSNLNYMALYFALLEDLGGEWTSKDWSKWRARYFAVNPDRKEAHAEYMAEYNKRRKHR